MLLRAFSFLLTLGLVTNLYADLPSSSFSDMNTSSTADTADLTPDSQWTSDLAKRDSRTRWLIGGYAGVIATYGFISWWGKDVERHVLQPDGSVTTETFANRSSFNVNNEGWFGKDTPNGGADKWGHFYSSYLGTRLMAKTFQWAGHDATTAAKIAGWTAGSVMLGVEIMDGFSLEYGFSKEDLIMNLGGVAFGALLELRPDLDEKFDLRFHYWRSDDAKLLGEGDPVSDYSGQTYLLITKAAGFTALREKPILRYLEFALGYGSRGYQPNPGQFAEQFPKERNIYVGLSLNLNQILNDTLYRHQTQPSTTKKVLETTLEYLQMPGTALLYEYHL
jgi:hypothetical protein